MNKLNEKVNIRQERLSIKQFLSSSKRYQTEEEWKNIKDIKKFRSSPFFFTLVYPWRPIFLDSPFSYLKQSRLFLFLNYKLRTLYFLSLRGFKVDIFQVTEKDKHNDEVIDHNLWEGFNIFHFSRGRIERLLYLLMLAEVNRKGKTLCMGPKNEGELMLFRAHGFTDVIGIDLFTYCPSILVMDVHDMKFASDTFDTINCGSMIQYVFDLEKVISEMVRVAKNDAIISLSITVHFPDDKKDYDGEHCSIPRILSLFGSNVKNIYWRTDFEDIPGKKHELIFQVKK